MYKLIDIILKKDYVYRQIDRILKFIKEIYKIYNF